MPCGCGRGSPFSSRLLAQAELCATPAEPAARAQHFRGTVSDFRVVEIIPTSVLMGLLLGWDWDYHSKQKCSEEQGVHEPGQSLCSVLRGEGG